MDIDIYDFDKTIVPFDSGTRFIIFCMVHYPWCLVWLPVVGVAFVLKMLHIIGFTRFKSICFRFMPLVPRDRAVRKFWDKYADRVNPWFAERTRHCVVISASPDFLLNDIAGRLGFDDLLCTVHNARTGAIVSENCRGEEKVRRLYDLYDPQDINVIDVYSDSLTHDAPIFRLATGQCYNIVDGRKIKFDARDLK